MRKRLITLLLMAAWGGGALAQSPAEMYRKPLGEVLDNISERYGVKVVAAGQLSEGRMVSYAQWRMKGDAEASLRSVLGPFDLEFHRNDRGEYVVTPFQYHRRTPEEGQLHLEELKAFSPDLNGWEMRRRELRECIDTRLHLELFRPATPLSPVFTPRRKYEGYTVENVALETWPGLYLCGSLYRPLRKKPPFPAVLLAQGHGEVQHYGETSQILAATLARMGAVVFSYDMFAKGESAWQFAFDDHRTGIAQSVQTWNSLRVVDFLASLPDVDSRRIAMTGASGGGTQTLLAVALDDRIGVSVPVVMVSSWFFGGCPCESGMPVHGCGKLGTNNAEIAAMAAPRPLLLVSDGGDWTSTTPGIEFPAIGRIYDLYGRQGLHKANVHLPGEGHDYGPSKREAAVRFLSLHLGLSLDPVLDRSGSIDESKCRVEPKSALLVFGESGEKLPPHAIRGLDELKTRLHWPY